MSLHGPYISSTLPGQPRCLHIVCNRRKSPLEYFIHRQCHFSQPDIGQQAALQGSYVIWKDQITRLAGMPTVGGARSSSRGLLTGITTSTVYSLHYCTERTKWAEEALNLNMIKEKMLSIHRWKSPASSSIFSLKQFCYSNVFLYSHFGLTYKPYHAYVHWISVVSLRTKWWRHSRLGS